MKRYILFAYDKYYPNGGMCDSELKTNDLNEAEKEYEKNNADYKEIYDFIEEKIVLKNY